MRKSKHIMVNLEPLIYEALIQLVQREAESEGSMRGALSAKCRKLIIKDLVEKKVVTQELLEQCL